jgi:hypothetical protein
VLGSVALSMASVVLLSINVAYQRHGHEEFEEAMDEAMHAEHAFDEAVAEAERDAEHQTDG